MRCCQYSVILLCLVVLLNSGCERDPSTFADVEKGGLPLADSEVAAIREILETAGLRPEELQLWSADPKKGNAPNWIAISEGHVVALRLIETPDLSSLSMVSQLPELRYLKISDAHIEHLDGLGAPCALEYLEIYRSGVRSLAGLESCIELQTLKLSYNKITSLAELPQLPKLRELILYYNQLSQIENITGRDSLVELGLAGNQLTSVVGLDNLPALEMLELSANALTNLDALGRLPKLRVIFLTDNQLTDASAIDRYPTLEKVGLINNRLEDFPAISKQLDPGLMRGNPGYVDPWEEGLAEFAQARREQRRRETDVSMAPELPSSLKRIYAGRCSWRGKKVSCKGSIEKLSRPGYIRLAELSPTGNLTSPRRNPSSIRITFSVGEGKIRVYLRGGESGYPYMEASPENPRTMLGYPMVGTWRVDVVMEPVDGIAKDISYQIEPES